MARSNGLKVKVQTTMPGFRPTQREFAAANGRIPLRLRSGPGGADKSRKEPGLETGRGPAARDPRRRRSLKNGWPLESWALEPFCHDLPGSWIRYASLFQIGA